MSDRFKFYRKQSRSLFSEIERSQTNSPTWLPLKVDVDPVNDASYVNIPLRSHVIFRIKPSDGDFKGHLFIEKFTKSLAIDLEELNGNQEYFLLVIGANSWTLRIQPRDAENPNWPRYFIIDSIIYPGGLHKKLSKNRDFYLDADEPYLLDRVSISTALAKSNTLLAENIKTKMEKQEQLPCWIFKNSIKKKSSWHKLIKK